MQRILYRYTSNDEGVWAVGKRLLSAELADAVDEARAWLPKPTLEKGKKYRYYFTERGAERYRQTLLPLYARALSNIICEETSWEKACSIGDVIYEDAWQVVIEKRVPMDILQYGLPLQWLPEKVWALDLPIEQLPLEALAWHFQKKFWRTPGGYFDLSPEMVLADPMTYREEYDRTLRSDLAFPIDILFWNDRWVILDGLHRLLKAEMQGIRTVRVRKVPAEAIPRIGP